MLEKKIIDVGMSEPEELPFSRVVAYSDLLFITGTVSSDFHSGKPIYGDIRSETARRIENIQRCLEKARSTLDKVLKTTVFLADKSDFSAMNEVYKTYFNVDPPARSTVVVTLVGEYRIEMEVIAGR